MVLVCSAPFASAQQFSAASVTAAALEGVRQFNLKTKRAITPASDTDMLAEARADLEESADFGADLFGDTQGQVATAWDAWILSARCDGDTATGPYAIWTGDGYAVLRSAVEGHHYSALILLLEGTSDPEWCVTRYTYISRTACNDLYLSFP